MQISRAASVFKMDFKSKLSVFSQKSGGLGGFPFFSFFF